MYLKHLAVSAALACSLAAPAHADLVIDGRASQALHCSAMLLMVSTVLNDAGLLSTRDTQVAHLGAAIMLDYVPGTVEQKKQAMRQRVTRIVQSRSLEQLGKEYATTAKWCNRHFIPK